MRERGEKLLEQGESCGSHKDMEEYWGDYKWGITDAKFGDDDNDDNNSNGGEEEDKENNHGGTA